MAKFHHTVLGILVALGFTFSTTLTPAGAATKSAPATQAKTAAQKAAPQAEFLDRIVAVVNNDVITAYELQSRVHQIALDLRRQNIQLPAMEQLRAQVLERLILEKAIAQRANEVGVRVDEQMVTAAIEQIARNNRMEIDQLRARLKQDGVNYSTFRNQIRQEITFNRLREREVDARLEIPESEIDSYLAEKAGFISDDPTEYHIAHIVLPFTQETKSDIEKQAEGLVKKARAGEDFGKLAAAFSKNEDALSGGDLGWKDSGHMPTLYWHALQGKAKKNFVTTVQTEDAVHILKVLARRNGVTAKLAGEAVEQSHVRHILMFASSTVSESQIIRQLNAIRQRILDGKEDFATAARLHSVDKTATRGGEIGWLQAGDVAPEFESAMAQLKPGEISEPVKTQFGYHLIQVIERRTTQAANEERSRYAARQALRERKLAEAVHNWQREIRDRAYVEIRNNTF